MSPNPASVPLLGFPGSDLRRGGFLPIDGSQRQLRTQRERESSGGSSHKRLNVCWGMCPRPWSLLTPKGNIDGPQAHDRVVPKASNTHSAVGLADLCSDKWTAKTVSFHRNLSR